MKLRRSSSKREFILTYTFNNLKHSTHDSKTASSTLLYNYYHYGIMNISCVKCCHIVRVCKGRVYIPWQYVWVLSKHYWNLPSSVVFRRLVAEQNKHALLFVLAYWTVHVYSTVWKVWARAATCIWMNSMCMHSFEHVHCMCILL